MHVTADFIVHAPCRASGQPVPPQPRSPPAWMSVTAAISLPRKDTVSKMIPRSVHRHRH
ncbi:hypothetical protein J6590_045832 [Homalodisca vitripennis]|nr:hypothetical protein J6590_045832 [Homalodisca vitripennis]